MEQILRRRRWLTAPIVLAVLTAGLAGAAPAASAPTDAPLVPVVVQADGDVGRVRAAVLDAGGELGLDLPIVSGFAAAVPASAVEGLAAHPDVRAVTPDEPVRVAGAVDEAADPTIKSVFAHETGAPDLWDEGVDGDGVTVALVDTGVTAVPDIADRLVTVRDPRDPSGTSPCVNFSGEPTCDDTYGHGTFVAGLIAGTGASSGGRFTGVAPGAEIVSIKIAGRDGSADVSKVLAAIQWVVSFREEHGIEVLNLSLGTDSTRDYRIDPLNFAVERAWLSGITVVVSASNRGPAAQTISKPADDPLVITVGAVDDRETPAISDDRLPRFSGRGPTAHGLAKPDVVAPGGRVISLSAPGSTIDEAVPGGPDAYRRGSGTSMSAGIVSGVAALVRDAHPDWSPDRVKFALMATAQKVADRDPLAVGAGLVHAYQAVRHAPPGEANGDVAVLSDGTGSLDGSRGTVRVTGHCDFLEELLNPGCVVQSGEETAQDLPWDGEEYRESDWNGSSWYSSQWNQPTLDGSSWYGSSWYGSSWYGSSWYGSSWYGSDDPSIGYGTAVQGSSWYGAWG